jgi:hypothetical protein
MWAKLSLLLSVLCWIGVQSGAATDDDNVWLSPDRLFSSEYAEFLVQNLKNADDADDVDMLVARPIVKLADGTRLQGIRVQKMSVNAFKGIRFAKAPIGNLRWAPPKAYVNPDPSVVVDAGRYAASCIQGIPISTPFGDEDCLFLNVWTPAGVHANSSLPVGEYFICIADILINHRLQAYLFMVDLTIPVPARCILVLKWLNFTRAGPS